MTDIIVLIHFLFILFVVFGGLLAFYKKWFVWIHIPAALWGVLIEFFGWICPLTPLENKFRISGGLQGYEGGFIDHYLTPLIYPENLTKNTQILLGAVVLLINIIIYFTLIMRNRKKRS